MRAAATLSVLALVGCALGQESSGSSAAGTTSGPVQGAGASDQPEDVVLITAEPATAHLVDPRGVDLGPLPLNVQRPPGGIVLTVSAPGLEAQRIDLRPHGSARLHVRLERDSTVGAVPIPEDGRSWGEPPPVIAVAAPAAPSPPRRVPMRRPSTATAPSGKAAVFTSPSADEPWSHH